MAAAGVLLVAGPARADRTMRCGNDFAEVGDTMELVAKKCGPPDRIRERKTKVTSLVPVPAPCPPGSGHKDCSVLAPREVEIVIVMWVYDFGRNRFLHVADFDSGRLAGIWTRGYGSKPPQ